MNSPYPSQFEWVRRLHRSCNRCIKQRRQAVYDCTALDCPWWDLRMLEQAPDLFDIDKVRWFAGAESVISRCNGHIWPSELRKSIEKEIGCPAHPNWWGGLVGAYKQFGYKMTDTRRMSPTGRRNGAYERLWVKEIATLEKAA